MASINDLSRLLGEDDGNFTWSKRPVYKFTKGQVNDSVEDPTYLGFVFLFNFRASEITESPLLGGARQVGSALNYLNRNKEFKRAAYLQEFINLLGKINKELPWYWQSFEGGENFVKYNNFENPYLGGDNSKISIECLESMDLKVTALMDLYRNAVYDLEYRRVVIPGNLRKFAVDIHIQEIRKFHISKLNQLKNIGSATDVMSKVKSPGSDAIDTGDSNNENTPRLIYKLRFCEFLPDESGVPFAGLTMAGEAANFAKQKVVFNYENLSIANSYPGIGEGLFLDSNATNAINGDEDTMAPHAKNKFVKNPFLDKVINATVEGALAKAETAVSGELSKLVLGNVYGLNPGVLVDTVANALTTGSIFSLGPAVADRLKKTEKAETTGPLGDVYNSVTKPTEEPLGDVFETPLTPRPGGIALGNVYKP